MAAKTPVDSPGAAASTGIGPPGRLDSNAALSQPGLDRAVDRVLSAARGHPHVFNLGHGITKDTPVDHVARMLARVRAAA